MTIAKPFYLKLLLCAIFISPSVNAGEIFNKVQKKPVMKSASWGVPKTEEKAAEIEETSDEAVEEETELTPDQKLWKKYKDLAAGINEDTEEEEIKVTEENTEEEKEVVEEKSPVGIAAIIADYKKSQENKGKMNSRSFGKID